MPEKINEKTLYIYYISVFLSFIKLNQMKIIGLSFVYLFLTLLIAGQEKKALTQEEDEIGITYYDVQSIRAMQNRIFFFADGTIGTVWNCNFEIPPSTDLGIGYNYFDGSNWSPYPWQSIISGQAVFPSYTDYLINGELVACQTPLGLKFAYRTNKGTGNWIESALSGTGLQHPVVITTGTNNSIIHLLYLNSDTSFSPTNSQPSRGFIYYARSNDNGITWDINQQVPGLGPDEYLGFTIGAYTWAEPKEEGNLAFIAGDYLTDLVLMKSSDGGDTWQKTVIWNHPYPFMEIFSFDSDTFYSNDGAITAVMDQESEVHVSFGLSRVFSSTQQDSIWHCPEVCGVAYWHEGMPVFSNNLNALSPYDETGSELIADYNLIGWHQDINGNGLIDTLGNGGIYYSLGGLTMPQLFCSTNNNIILVYSGVTETYSNLENNYRHLWSRMSLGSFWSPFVDLNNDLIHIFDECVYPSVAVNDMDGIHLIYQIDNEPGLCDEQSFCDNRIYYMNFYFEYPPVYLTPSFYAQTTTIEEGDSVLFMNASTGNPIPDIFVWTFEGGTPASSNLENPTILYNNEGTYDVSLYVSNGVMNQTLMKEDYITVLPETGYPEFESDNIVISPNPGSGKFMVNISADNQTKINVLDLLGEEILEIKLNPSDDWALIDLTGQNEGIYFVKINSADRTIIRKIIVRR